MRTGRRKEKSSRPAASTLVSFSCSFERDTVRGVRALVWSKVRFEVENRPLLKPTDMMLMRCRRGNDVRAHPDVSIAPEWCRAKNAKVAKEFISPLLRSLRILRATSLAPTE